MSDKENKFLAIVGFANDMEYFETEKEAKEYLESYFLEPKEGYHPNAESCFIYELKSTVKVFSENGGESFKHKFENPTL
jgi:hypothetical protein